MVAKPALLMVAPLGDVLSGCYSSIFELVKCILRGRMTRRGTMAEILQQAVGLTPESKMPAVQN